MIYWLFGRPGSGKRTLSRDLSNALNRRGTACLVLDGGELRATLNSDLDFTLEGKTSHVIRTAQVAEIISRQGVQVVVASTTPTKESREWVRRVLGGGVRLIYLQCPLPICRARDYDGRYKLADAGQLSGVDGVNSPFIPPDDYDYRIDTGVSGLLECSSTLLNYSLAEA